MMMLAMAPTIAEMQPPIAENMDPCVQAREHLDRILENLQMRLTIVIDVGLVGKGEK